MIDDIAFAVGFLILAILMFAASLRLGMLVGLRLDRALEARASAGADQELEGDAGASPALAQPDPDGRDGRDGREEYRGD